MPDVGGGNEGCPLEGDAEGGGGGGDWEADIADSLALDEDVISAGDRGGN